MSLVKGDSYGLKRAVLKVVTPTGPIDHAGLLEMCEDVVGQFVDVNLEEFDTGALISSLSNSISDMGMDMDPFLSNLGRGLMTLEGTIHLVSPRLNIMSVLIDYLKSSFDPNAITREAANIFGQGFDSAAAMVSLPTKISDTLDMMQKGHVRIGMQLSATEKLSRDIRAAAGLVAIALVAMGLVIGACLLGTNDAAWQLGGISVTGGLGLVVGLVLTIFVFVKTRPFL